MEPGAIRFDPNKNDHLFQTWKKSEDLRVQKIRNAQIWAGTQNYFWPTKMSLVVALFVPLLAISVGLYGLETPLYALAVPVLSLLALVHSRQLMLFCLLHYKQWMLEVKPSGLTKMWFAAVQVLSGPMSNWYSGNWLLPGLPSPPPLKQSVQMFLSSMKPCLSEEKYKQAEMMAEEFLKKEGPALHRKLYLKSLFSRNWLAGWWIDYGYLATRSEVYRAFMNGIGPNCNLASDWADSAGIIVYGSYLYFVHKLATRELPPSSIKNMIPLEMKYLKYITGGCRIPSQEGVDSFQWTEAWREAYVVVHIKGRYFKLYLHDSKGQQLNPSVLAQLCREMYDADVMQKNADQDFDPCLFTYLKRVKWAELRETLLQDKQNEQMLQTIAKSAFVLHVLDGESFDDAMESMGDTQLQMWCDRSLNVVINKGGYVYICCEHSHCDAVLLASIYSDIFLIGKTQLVTSEGKLNVSKFVPNTYFPDYEELQWNLQPELRTNYATIKSEVIDNPNLKTRLCVKRVSVDKSLIKANKMGPDSFFQSVIFWAYYKKHGKIANAYQPGTLMSFKDGRTENTRPLNQPKVDFIKAMEDSSLPDAMKVDLLRKSANYQYYQTRLSSVGEGCDRHLFGLYIIAKGTSTPSEFLDFVFTEGMDFPLCTSVCPTTMLPEVKHLIEDDANANFCSIGGQFRPVDPNQYGVVYMVVCQNEMNITVTDLACSEETNAFEMGDTIQQCFYEVFDLLKRNNDQAKMERR